MKAVAEFGDFSFWDRFGNWEETWNSQGLMAIKPNIRGKAEFGQNYSSQEFL